MNKRNALAFLMYAVLLTAGCFREEQASSHSREGLNAILWCQTALEHRVACVQTFRAAEEAVKKGLALSDWTAALEQTNDYQKLPPAVIVDVDETVLDNSPYQARLTKNGKKFETKTWQAWVKEEQADALPGASEFITFLRINGVKVFYVTNRSLEEPTVQNIKKTLDPDATAENVLCKKEKQEWGSDKSNRRALIAQSYRILALLGDDYNDFTFTGRVSPEERLTNSLVHKDFWGTKWFVLPNPMYGNWEKAIYQYNYELDRTEMVDIKTRHLNEKQ